MREGAGVTCPPKKNFFAFETTDQVENGYVLWTICYSYQMVKITFSDLYPFFAIVEGTHVSPSLSFVTHLRNIGLSTQSKALFMFNISFSISGMIESRTKTYDETKS